MTMDRREIRAAALGAAIVGVYTLLVLMTGRVNLADFSLLFLGYIRGSINLWMLVALVSLGWFLLRERPALPASALREWLRERWQRDRWISLFWPPLLFGALMAAFNAFKQMVLPVAGFRFDPFLADLDRTLALGQDPWRITHGLMSSPNATWLIDKAYHGWFLPMSVGVIICAFLPSSTFRLRTQYILTYTMVWIGIGSFLAFLLPSAGPCFYGPLIGSGSDFQVLMDRLHSQQALLGTPISALANQGYLLKMFGGDELMIGGGISAMPSVHNGLAILFAIAAFSINRTAGWIMSAYATLIWIGSIHLGWHYAVDGLAVVPLVWGIWWACGKVADWIESPSPQPSAQPATA